MSQKQILVDQKLKIGNKINAARFSDSQVLYKKLMTVIHGKISYMCVWCAYIYININIYLS